jgi:hypothetical protein
MKGSPAPGRQKHGQKATDSGQIGSSKSRCLAVGDWMVAMPWFSRSMKEMPSEVCGFARVSEEKEHWILLFINLISKPV